ncbi:hypothetical protein E2C01_019464 [Portunus trituberculatus]|uniref:Uncharacterized protein n=1 Tax=Portunus trituberculatus TaxID=210409 RepID=A0A5B7DXP9_PORTR|nr:hypothetical protein [Portunus trituberculatus]
MVARIGADAEQDGTKPRFWEQFLNIKKPIHKPQIPRSQHYLPGMVEAEKSVESLRGRPLFCVGGGAADGVTSWSPGQLMFSLPPLSPDNKKEGSREWRRRGPLSEGPSLRAIDLSPPSVSSRYILPTHWYMFFWTRAAMLRLSSTLMMSYTRRLSVPRVMATSSITIRRGVSRNETSNGKCSRNLKETRMCSVFI